jgi:formiminoglutamase
MMEGWDGRVDDLEDPETFRWHQIVRRLETLATPGIALIGFASDEGIRRNHGRAGAVQGPLALRRALSNLPAIQSCSIYDAGDITCFDGDLDGAQSRYADRVSRLFADGHFPVGMGGGHEIGYASYLGLARSVRPGRIAIVNMDAHLDLRDGPAGTSGTSFRQAMRHARAHEISLDYICLGASNSSNTQRLFRTAQEAGVRLLMDHEMTQSSLNSNITRLLRWLEPADSIYLTICLDVLPGSIAPGVSAPSARGVPLEIIEPLISAISATDRLKVCDIAELCPRLDIDNATARVAARLIYQLATGQSLRSFGRQIAKPLMPERERPLP